MTEPIRHISTESDNDELLRRSSFTNSLPLLANAPSIQKLSQNHLPIIDSKRFMRILDNTITRVLLVSSFPRIISNVKEFSLLLGRNATVLFESYGPLSKLYDEQCARSKHQPRFTDRDAVDQHRPIYLTFDETVSMTSEAVYHPERKRANVAQKLFELTRQLLRELLTNPSAISALIRHREQWDIEPSMNCRRLAIQLVHLRSLIRNDLLTTPKARACRDEFLERLRRRDSEQRRTVEELSNRLEDLQTAQRTQV
ncbi:hypothetical protein P879_00617 [Paragonimus westermani]|uniref:Dynein regulatory complex protein 10 n=1 Tax=Paragonimus westermani TaxID=34504 RepID=A0A8T0DUG7_9TREM|nr:hypothetical protein P879_00617 [Paragonimus westermani]